MNEIILKGAIIDDETRCEHYHSEIDRIAIKFHCCQTYYPCFSCHEESGCGNHQVWPKDQFHERAVLCGACRTELMITDYLESNSECPHCHAPFNPGCNTHRHYYFEI